MTHWSADVELLGKALMLFQRELLEPGFVMKGRCFHRRFSTAVSHSCLYWNAKNIQKSQENDCMKVSICLRLSAGCVWILRCIIAATEPLISPLNDLFHWDGGTSVCSCHTFLLLKPSNTRLCHSDASRVRTWATFMAFKDEWRLNFAGWPTKLLLAFRSQGASPRQSTGTLLQQFRTVANTQTYQVIGSFTDRLVQLSGVFFFLFVSVREDVCHPSTSATAWQSHRRLSASWVTLVLCASPCDVTADMSQRGSSPSHQGMTWKQHVSRMTRYARDQVGAAPTQKEHSSK